MVFYFSGTGNSKYAANRISCVSGDSLISIPDAIKGEQFNYEVTHGETVGFVFPVYCFTIPSVVDEFLDRLELAGANYVWLLMTCAGSTGDAGKVFSEALKKRGIVLSAAFSVVMPNNCSPFFKLDPPDKVKKILFAADKELDDVTDKILSRRTGNMNAHKGKSPSVLGGVMRGAYGKLRKGTKFKVDLKKCVGCGVCTAICPTESISFKNGKPIWKNDRCTVCLACLHHCKLDAIIVGNSDGRGRYLNPNIDI